MRIEYECPWFSVIREGNWIYIREKNIKNAAAIIPFCKTTKEFVFLDIYRIPLKIRSIEIPRGYGSDNETSIDTAIREMYEETGIEVSKKELYKLGSIYPNSGLLSSNVDIYAAILETCNAKITPYQDKEKIKKIIFLGKDQVINWILEGKIKDAFSICAFTMFTLKVEEHI